MADFSGEAGFAVVKLPVHDHAHAQAPSHVEEKDVSLGSPQTAHVFSVGHGAGVVLYYDPLAETSLQQGGDGLFFSQEV